MIDAASTIGPEASGLVILDEMLATPALCFSPFPIIAERLVKLIASLDLIFLLL